MSNDDEVDVDDEGLLAAFVPTVGLILGCALGFGGAFWALRSAPDLLPAYSIPSRDRGTQPPGPPIAYWLTWMVAPAVVLISSGLLWWRWPVTRSFALCVGVGFLFLYVLLAGLFMSLDLGGFSPT